MDEYTCVMCGLKLKVTVSIDEGVYCENGYFDGGNNSYCNQCYNSGLRVKEGEQMDDYRLLDDGGITEGQYKSLSNEEKLALIARILYETSTVVESLADELRDGE